MRCESCGASLHVEPGASVVRCGFCGTEYALDVPAEMTVEFLAEEEKGSPDEAAPAEPERPPYEDEVLSWLREGKKIQAVEVVRAHTRLGLGESKEYVEALAAREGLAVRQSSPYVVLALAVFVAVALAALVAFIILKS